MPVVSPKPTSVAPAAANCSAMSSTRFIGTLPSNGQPYEVAMTAAQRRSSATMRLAMISLSAIDSAMVRFTFFLLCVSDALTKIATSEKVSRTLSALSSPLLLGTSTISETSSGTSMPCNTSTPSDSWGMTSGRTKLATSMRFRPVRASRLIRSILSAVAMVSGSF